MASPQPGLVMGSGAAGGSEHGVTAHWGAGCPPDLADGLQGPGRPHLILTR